MLGSSNGYTARAAVRYLIPFTCDTNAYTSVVLADGSRVISGASMWLDAVALPGANASADNAAPSQVMAKVLRTSFIVFAYFLSFGLVAASGSGRFVPLAERSKLSIEIVSF